ncbi:hypothetical protein D3C80_360170 [compost metagenome]
MVVEADEARGGEGLGHDHGGGAMAAADIGHLGAGLQLVHHAVQRRQPFGDQVRPVARAEEALGAAEHAGVVIAPGQGAIAAHGRHQLVLVVEERGDHHRAAGDVDRRVFHRQGQGLFLRQAEPSVAVLHVTGGGVGAEPFAHQACIAAGLRRQVFGADRLAVGHGPVEAEFLAEDDVGEHRRAAHVGYQLAHEVVEPGLVHLPVLLWLGERSDSRSYSAMRRRVGRRGKFRKEPRQLSRVGLEWRLPCPAIARQFQFSGRSIVLPPAPAGLATGHQPRWPCQSDALYLQRDDASSLFR